MRLIGKIEDCLVYEVSRGQYVSVDPSNGRWKVEWSWMAPLGKWCDFFTKTQSDEEDEICVEIMLRNKDEIAKELERESRDNETDKEFREEWWKAQDEFYEWLEEGRQYDYSYGRYADEEPEE